MVTVTEHQVTEPQPGLLAPRRVQEEGLQAEWSHFQLPGTSLRDPYRHCLGPQDPSREPFLSHPPG